MSSNLLYLPRAVPLREVYCSGTHCGGLLGRAGPSGLEKKRGQPVWHIEPGWLWVHGILQRTDYEFHSERRLRHETLGQERRIDGVGHRRECDLPVNVRCPKCHRVQMVVASQIKR